MYEKLFIYNILQSRSSGENNAVALRPHQTFTEYFSALVDLKAKQNMRRFIVVLATQYY